MALQVPPAATVLGNATYPHRKRHGVLTEVQYAHPDGSNSNDGLTWGTAKKDVLSAYDALPVTGGTIYIANETYWDSVNTDRGLKLLGSDDPAYNGGSPTGGWRVRKRCHFIGVPGDAAGNSHYGPIAQVNGHSTTDRAKPSIWISGGDGPLIFENLNTRFPAVAWRLGIKSDLTNYVNTAGITFRNCHYGLNQIAGNGPGVELGYVFWLFFEHCSLNGNGNGSYTLTAATRAGAVATFTTSITHFMEVGDTVFVQGVTPSGYNGTWTITAKTTTTVTVTLAADPGGSGSAFGTAEPIKNYRRAAVAHEADRWGGQSSGLIYFNECNFNGGGFYYKPSGTTAWGNIIMRNITHEGDFVGLEPPTLFLRTRTYGDSSVAPSGYGLYVQNVDVADAAIGSVAVEVEGVNTDPSITVAVNSSAAGSVTQFPSMSSRMQTGIHHDTFIGRHDGANRTFAPIAIRYENYVSHTLSGGSWITGIKAPDGTTNASSLTNASQTQQFFFDPLVGEWIIAGVWRRMKTLTSAVEADKPALAFTHTDFILDNGSSGFNIDTARQWNDGGWEWLCEGHKIVTAGTSGNEVVLNLRAGPSNVIHYFAPMVIYVPAADALDDDEVRELIRNLGTYPNTSIANPGDVSMLAGQTLQVGANLRQFGAGGFHELKENGTTDAAAGAVNTGRLYVRDNGSGKTQFCVRFNTGAVQVIATEP